MNKTTVTMPMSEYEQTNNLIECLHKEGIDRFIKKEYTSLETGDYTVRLDMEKIIEYLDKKYPDRKKVTYKFEEVGSLSMKPEQPPICMSCMNCGHKERSRFGRIRSCPECDGVLVDVYEKDIMKKVLENAGYVCVKDMNVNDMLSMSMKELTNIMKELNNTTAFRSLSTNVKG